MATLAETLVVPVDLAVLCVGDTDVNGSATNPYGTKDFAQLAPDFSRLPYAADGVAHNTGPFLSSQSLPDTFQKASTPLEVGIHLHWALPRALAHGSQADHGSIDFPPAPDRWLIVRVAVNTAAPKAPVTSQRAWVLESDHLWDGAIPDPVAQNARSLAVPIRPDPTAQPNKAWKMLGRVFDYATWTEDSLAERADLTAIGYGDVSYAATYQLCPNVFGFWDTLTDLDPAAFPPGQTRLSYMLMGWHARKDADPLNRVTYPYGATYDQKLAAIAAAYHWKFAPAPGVSEAPVCSTYNAVMSDIPWDKATHYIDKQTAAPGDIQIAVGNSTPEALSAILAAQPNLQGLPNVERVLNALQLGLLSRIGLPGGLHQIDQAIHTSGFAATESGIIWEIQPPKAASRDSASTGLSDLPVNVGKALNALNLAQATCDDQTRRIESLRARIFSDWCRYMQIEYPPPVPPTQPVSADAARRFITSEVAALDALTTQRDAQQILVDTLRSSLESVLDSGYTLVPTDGPRFWAPSEPVLLFMGDKVCPTQRFAPLKKADDDKDLTCRLGPNLISAMTAGRFTLSPGDLPALPPIASVPKAAPVLLAEAFFIDSVRAPVLAAGIAAQGGVDNPARKDFSAFEQDIRTAQAALFSALAPGPVSFVGLAPANLSFKSWEPPWNPFMIQWRIEHYPNAMPPYSSDFIVKKYALDSDDIDLSFKSAIPVNGQIQRTYDGTIVLTRNTEINIRQQIETYITNFPDDDIVKELREILDKMSLPAQAQALSGFNQAFLMLARMIQMEVADPLGILKGLLFANFTNRTVKDAVAKANTDSPLANNTFSPIRNGGFSVSRVRVIDTFGQSLDLDSPAVIRAESLISARETKPLINLPVRATQPMQLLFNWVSAADDMIEMNSHPATTPVFGWVLYNHLDHALMIYDTAGHALGSFNVRGPFWQGAPGNQETYDQPIEVVFAKANPHLRNFAFGMAAAANPSAHLADMLAAIDHSLGFIAPGGSPPTDSLSVLIGRPVALARAALDLSALGLAAMDQSLSSFAKAVASGDPLNRDAGGTPEVQLPVRLGELSDVSDGLIGYFIDDGSSQAYQTFYSPAASPDGKHGVVEPNFDQITLTAGQSTPSYVSIFVDPNAPVHATTGALPITKLVIPPAMISDSLAQIAVTFLASPVLNGGGGEMPTPDESGYVWQWVTQRAGTHDWTIEPVSQLKDLSLTQQQVQEGWLKLQHLPTKTRTLGDSE